MVVKKCYKLLEVYLKGKSGWVMIVPFGGCCLHTLCVTVAGKMNFMWPDLSQCLQNILAVSTMWCIC